MFFHAFRQIQCFMLMAALVFLPLPLQAQSESDKNFAQEAFKKGQIQYNLGRFEKALEHFSTAYETMPHGAFLYNIGQCYRHMGNHEKAIFFFEGYLRNMPNAPNRLAVEELISEHRAKMLVEKAQSKPKKKKYKKKKPKKKSKKAPASKTKKTSAKTVTEPQPAPIAASDEEMVSDTPWVIWVIIGGVAILGTSIALFAANSSNSTSDGEEPAPESENPSLGTVDVRQ